MWLWNYKPPLWLWNFTIRIYDLMSHVAFDDHRNSFLFWSTNLRLIIMKVETSLFAKNWAWIFYFVGLCYNFTDKDGLYLPAPLLQTPSPFLYTCKRWGFLYIKQKILFTALVLCLGTMNNTCIHACCMCMPAVCGSWQGRMFSITIYACSL